MAPFLLAVTLSQAHRLAAGTASSHELHKFQVAAFGDSETQLPRCRLWVPSGSESRASQRPSLGSIVANRATHSSRRVEGQIAGSGRIVAHPAVTQE